MANSVSISLLESYRNSFWTQIDKQTSDHNLLK